MIASFTAEESTELNFRVAEGLNSSKKLIFFLHIKQKIKFISKKYD